MAVRHGHTVLPSSEWERHRRTDRWIAALFYAPPLLWREHKSAVRPPPRIDAVKNVIVHVDMFYSVVSRLFGCQSLTNTGIEESVHDDYMLNAEQIKRFTVTVH